MSDIRQDNGSRILIPYSVSTGGTVTQSFTYTDGGRIATSKQTTEGVNYPFMYGYSMDGSMASVQYPSGRTVSYPSVDRTERLTEVTETLGGVFKSHASA
jgi:hypothetical protein